MGDEQEGAPIGDTHKAGWGWDQLSFVRLDHTQPALLPLWQPAYPPGSSVAVVVALQPDRNFGPILPYCLEKFGGCIFAYPTLLYS